MYRLFVSLSILIFYRSLAYLLADAAAAAFENVVSNEKPSIIAPTYIVGNE